MKRSQNTLTKSKHRPPKQTVGEAKRFFWAPVLILLAATLCDLGSWGHQFLVDDIPYILDNPLLQSPRDFFRLFASPLIQDAASKGFMAMYRPLTALTFGLNLWINGPNPDSFHLINRLLHLGICLFVYFIVRRVVPQPRWTAICVGLLFAVHPFQTEAITYINGRADALSMLFFLIAWYGFTRYRAADGIFKWGVGFSLGGYFLALLSKENAITWLGVIVLTELVYFSHRNFKTFLQRLKHDWLIYSGYLATTMLYLAVRFTVLRGALTGEIPFELNPLKYSTPAVRWLTGLKIMFECMGQAFWPVRFMPDYSYNQIPLITHYSGFQALLTLGGSIVFLALLVWTYRRLPHIFFGSAFFLITYSVVSNLIIPIGTIRADRGMYLPGLGLCWLVGASFAEVWAHAEFKFARNVGIAVFSIVIVSLSVLTVIRNGDWKDSRTLYLRHTDPLPNSSKLLNSMGNAFLKEGRTQEAITCFQKSLAIGGHNPEEVRLNLGVALKANGNLSGALEQYRVVLKENPRNAVGHFNLGNLYFAERDYTRASEEYRKALDADPKLAAARNNLNAALDRLSPSSQQVPPNK